MYDLTDVQIVRDGNLYTYVQCSYSMGYYLLRLTGITHPVSGWTD